MIGREGFGMQGSAHFGSSICCRHQAHDVSSAVGGVCYPASADGTNKEESRLRYIVKRLFRAEEATAGGKACACDQIHIHALCAVVE